MEDNLEHSNSGMLDFSQYEQNGSLDLSKDNLSLTDKGFKSLLTYLKEKQITQLKFGSKI